MPPPSPQRPEDATVRRVLILKSIRLHAEMVRRYVREVWPDTAIGLAETVAEARRALLRAPVDLLIAGLGMRDGDACGLICDCATAPRPAARIVVVTGRDNAWTRRLLRILPIESAFDAVNENPDALPDVLRRTAAGEHCFSPGFSAFPWLRREPDALDLLTPTETVVLAFIGYGHDQQTIADLLDLAFDSVAAASRALHRKLGVRHDRELTARAADLGLVCAEFGQRHLIGFDLMLERYEAVQRKKRPRSARVAAHCSRGALRGPAGFPASGTEG